jgi:hypothetical protein
VFDGRDYEPNREAGHERGRTENAEGPEPWQMASVPGPSSFGFGQRLRFGDLPVVVAVVAVRMVQVAIDQVIDVVAVRHRFVAATRPVLVAPRVSAALMLGSALRRILGAHRHGVLLDGAGLRGMVQVAVVQIIDVAVMLYGGVAAVRAVLVGVAGMIRRHVQTPSSVSPGARTALGSVACSRAL